MGKSKRGVADRVRKAKRAKASNVFKVQSNPFEVKINKQKHKILGRKTKHDHGLPGVSRSKANKKRKETLLKEYKDRYKSNNLQDERFGEGDVGLSVEDKMLQRFAMEKKRKHEKMSLFNLNDEEELTHLGQSLADIEDFGTGGQSDEEDSGVISGEYVSEAHFGGGIFTKKTEESADGRDDGKLKSRKEIIDEIIMKSKRAKFEKQNDKEEANELREKLDNTWQEVEKLLKSAARTTKDKEEAKQSFNPDAYDVAVKQMQYDRKAAPSARGKTEAEKAAEEASQLRQLEDKRLERMQEDYVQVSKMTHRSADDLNNDFIPEKITVEPVQYKDGMMVGSDPPETPGAEEHGGWQLDVASEDEVVDEGSDEEHEEGITEDGDDDGGPHIAEDDYSDILSEDESENIRSDVSGDELSENKNSDEILKLNTETRLKTEDLQDFGKLFPETYEEFLRKSKIEQSGDAEKYVFSLRKKFSLGLAEGNKKKLLRTFQYVWHYLYDLFMELPPQIAASDKLIRHLYELCQVDSTSCAKYVNRDMVTTYKKYLDHKGKLLVPDFGSVMKFKLIKILFSTSDFIHPVVNATMVFMCHIIHTCRPTNPREVASCLFICTCLYEYVCFSKRFVPECINCLCAVICMAVPKNIQRVKGLPAAASLYINSKNCEMLMPGDAWKEKTEVCHSKLDLISVITVKNVDDLGTDQTRIQLLSTALRLSLKFVLLYSQLPCFKEVFEPMKASCTRCLAGYEDEDKSKQYPLLVLLHEVQAEIQRLTKKRPTLTHLVKTEENKPKTLKLYDPKIEDVCEPFQKSTRKKTSAAKRERERLLHKHKREMKGALREIKKDARFLAREQLNEQIEKDKERAEKVKRLYGLLSNQEGEVKKINRKTFKLGV